MAEVGGERLRDVFGPCLQLVLAEAGEGTGDGRRFAEQRVLDLSKGVAEPTAVSPHCGANGALVERARAARGCVASVVGREREQRPPKLARGDGNIKPPLQLRER